MKNIILVSCLTLVYACGSSSHGGEILSKEQMVAVLTEVHMLEAKLNWLKTDEDSLKKIYNSLELDIFKQHGVEKEQYKKSFEYYMENPKKMEDIYTVVVDSLNVIEQRLMVQSEEEEKEKQKRRAERKKEREERRKERERLKKEGKKGKKIL